MLCQDYFSMVCGGFNNVTHHVQRNGHVKHSKDASGSQTLQSFVGQSSVSLSSKVMQAGGHVHFHSTTWHGFMQGCANICRITALLYGN